MDSKTKTAATSFMSVSGMGHHCHLDPDRAMENLGPGMPAWNTVSSQERSLMHLYLLPMASVFSFLLLQCKGVKQRVGLHLCCSYMLSQEKRSGKVTHTAPKCTGFQDLWGEYEKSDVIRPRTLLDPGNHDGKYWMKCPVERQCRNGSSPRTKQMVSA